MTDACSRRAPFRIVVREVLNLFEDDPQEANATEEVNHEADTFQMTAYPRESSLRTIIGEPDTELQDKQNPPDDEDLFDDSFQVPHTLRRAPAKDNKTSAAKRPTKGAEEDDDIFADIDTQAFHASTNTLVERETKANRENLANERRGARNSRSVSVTSMAVGLMSNKIESGDESHISTNVLSAVRELVREDEGRSGETAAIHNSAPLNIFREVQQSSSPEPSRFLNQLENQVVQSSDLHRVSKTVETPTGRNIDVTKEMNASSGFKTASGKAVNVSARGLEVVKAMFEKEFSNDNSADIPVRLDQPDEQMPDELPNSTAPGHACRALQNVSIGHTGFSTAKGTAINVSAEALERVRRLFQEDFEENKPIISDTVVEKMDSAALAENLGFSTAAGGGVKVNEHLETVRKVLDDDTNSAKPLVSPAQMLAVTQAAIERSKQLPDDAQVTEKPNAVKYPSKTPVRRIAGLKRRSMPMCHTPVNRASSSVTPFESRKVATTTSLRQYSMSTETTPRPVSFEHSTNCRSKSHHSKNHDGVMHTKENSSIPNAACLEGLSKKRLQELVLVDRAPASAGVDWFLDDSSGLVVSLNDMKETFSKTLNVSSKKDFDRWFANHFEQVVWKLSSYTKRIQELIGCLTAENVLAQLFKRWRLEVLGTHRSPLKLIVERDESSERTVVLLVKQIKPELVLSDGWYSIPCDVDSPLAVVLSRVGSKLSINPGHKLCISGAILRGPRNGVDPLHLEGARLSINYNSTRRARWYAPLGFCRKTLTVPLFSVLLHGGTLPLIRVQVTSCSSLMYFEKFAQGGSVIRKESDEIKEQRRFHEEMVEIQERVRKEVLSKIEEEGWTAKRKLRPRGKNKPSNFTSGEEIYEAVEASHDPSQILAGLTASQKEMLERHRENVQSALRARVEEAVRRRMTELREKEECPHERKVAPLLKLLVRCTSSRVEVPLTIWRPSEELRTLLSRPHVIVAILRAKATSSRNFPFGLTTTQSNIHCLSSDGSPGKEDTEQKKQRRTLEDVAVPSKRLRF